MVDSMTPSSYLISIIVFGMVVLAFVTIFSNIISSGDIPIQAADQQLMHDFNQTFNQYQEINTEVTQLKTDVESTDNGDIGILGAIGTIINQAWNTLKYLLSSFSFMGTIFDYIPTMLGLGNTSGLQWIGASIMMIVIVIIVFSIWSAAFRTNL